MDRLRQAAMAAVVLALTAIPAAGQSLDDVLDSLRTAPQTSGGWPTEFRTITGVGNNLKNDLWGSAVIPLRRVTTPHYEDGMSAPATWGRPSPRAVSNAICEQVESILNPAGASDYIWQWGQFIDHDCALAEIAVPVEAFDVEVPAGDPFFDPRWSGRATIPLSRSEYDHTTGTRPGNPREQVNRLTAFIDASHVYGSDEVRAAALRRNDGTGRLRTSAHHLLPFNTSGQPNAGGDHSSFFLAGDIRANEQVGLTAMHTLFVREHNRIAAELALADPGLTGDQIYERARAMVAAQMQVITYRDFLPLLLGPDALAPYEGYDPAVDPGLSNVFAAAAYRVGHSMLSPTLLRVNRNGSEIQWGHLPLRDAFFAPHRVISEGRIEPLLRGLAAQPAQDVDVYIVDSVRNFLFGQPGAGGLDLPSLNVQRGRDHGLGTYNMVRTDFGLSPAASFADISSDPQVQAALASVYSDVEQVDIWIGGLAEDHLPGALVGEIFFAIINDQFERLRDGDRFWYQITFSGMLLEEIEQTTLADIIRRNTRIGSEIQDDVFRVVPFGAAVPPGGEHDLE